MIDMYATYLNAGFKTPKWKILRIKNIIEIKNIENGFAINSKRAYFICYNWKGMRRKIVKIINPTGCSKLFVWLYCQRAKNDYMNKKVYRIIK